MLKALKPALVLLDVMMPGIDGHEVCRWIRAQPDLQATRVVLVSASVGAAEIEQGLAAGADECFTKPFDFKDMKAAVRKFC